MKLDVQKLKFPEAVKIIFKRELYSYFTTPLAYIFICVFLVLAGAMTFYVGDFFERGLADLSPFFMFHPWLYLFFIPALSMRLWAEERKTGSIELLLTLPISTRDAVAGKFLAAWAFTGLALLLTLPFWITVSILGNPDHGIIIASYVGSLLLAGAYLAMSLAISSLTKSQVIAFVVSAFVCFMFSFTGTGLALQFIEGWLPVVVVRLLQNLSVITHYNELLRGVIDLSTILYFATLILGFLGLNIFYVEAKKHT